MHVNRINQKKKSSNSYSFYDCSLIKWRYRQFDAKFRRCLNVFHNALPTSDKEKMSDLNWKYDKDIKVRLRKLSIQTSHSQNQSVAYVTIYRNESYSAVISRGTIY